MEDKEFNHPAFGVIQLSRVQGQAILFGSAVKHQHYISLTVSRASLTRSELHYDRIHSKEEILRVSLSAVQVGEMLTNMNVGSGVPCTIERMMVDGQYASIKPPPSVTATKTSYVEEFAQETKEIADKLNGLLATAKALEEKATVSKAERKALTMQIQMAIQKIQSDLPFVLTQFNEQIEKVVGDAKGEIEAYRASIVEQAGMAALAAKSLPELPNHKI